MVPFHQEKVYQCKAEREKITRKSGRYFLFRPTSKNLPIKKPIKRKMLLKPIKAAFEPVI
jgi:hypothetical protein